MPHADDLVVDDQQAGRDGSIHGVLVRAEVRRCRSDDGEVPGVVRRGHEQDQLHRGGQLSAAVEEDPLHAVGQVQLPGERGRATELGGAQLGGQLQQAQGVPTRLRDQPVDDLLGRRGAEALVEERPSGLRVEPGQHQLVDVVRPERPVGVDAGREDQQDAVGVDPACAEEQGVGSGGIQPVRVVDEAEHQLLLGRGREQ